MSYVLTEIAMEMMGLKFYDIDGDFCETNFQGEDRKRPDQPNLAQVLELPTDESGKVIFQKARKGAKEQKVAKVDEKPSTSRKSRKKEPTAAAAANTTATTNTAAAAVSATAATKSAAKKVSKNSATTTKAANLEDEETYIAPPKRAATSVAAEKVDNDFKIPPPVSEVPIPKSPKHARKTASQDTAGILHVSKSSTGLYMPPYVSSRSSAAARSRAEARLLGVSQEEVNELSKMTEHEMDKIRSKLVGTKNEYINSNYHIHTRMKLIGAYTPRKFLQPYLETEGKNLKEEAEKLYKYRCMLEANMSKNDKEKYDKNINLYKRKHRCLLIQNKLL